MKQCVGDMDAVCIIHFFCSESVRLIPAGLLSETKMIFSGSAG